MVVSCRIKGARRGAALLLLGLAWLALLGGAQTAAASSNLDYNGGPVAHSISGVIVDWGPNINSLYTNETTGDPGFVKYLAGASGSTGGIGGVLAQYMDNTGHNAVNAASYGQQYQITPSVSSTTITDAQIQSELASQIQAGHLPRPAGNGLQTIYLVLFPSADTECIDSQTCSANAPDPATQAFCAYHGNTNLPDSTNVLYAVLPDNTSGPMSTECGNASTLLGDQTSYLSHEWSETITDPLGTAWWDSSGNEVGDKCNQFMGVQGSWTVQFEWSNLDSNCASGESAYNAPTASFLAPSTALASQPVSFNASSSSDPSANTASITNTSYAISSGISSYQWTWGDGTSTTSTTPAATHTYAGVGTYQASLAVTDKLGFTSTVTHQVAITTGGTLAPVTTTGAASGISDTGATLNGTINPESQAVQYHFAYGTSASSLTHSTPLSTGPTGATASAVSATLSGLSGSTSYYYRLDVVSGAQTYSGAVQSFATNATPPAPQTPVIATGSASQITTGAAVLAGTINPGGSRAVSYDFSYGTSATHLSSATRLTSGPSGTTGIPVSATVSGLTARTTYYFRLDVSLAGHTYSGAVRSFTTLTPAPSASTGPVARVTSSSATVAGTVAPNGVQTSYHVEFGATTAYGHSSPSLSAGAASGSVPVAVTLSGLAPRTLYHYRLVATSVGGTAVGADRTLITAQGFGRAPRFTFHVRSRAALPAVLRGQLNVQFSCSMGCSAHFAVTVASVGVIRFAPVSATLARAHGEVRSGGSGSAAVRFVPGVRNRLAHHRSLKLLVSGYAISSGSAPSAPAIAQLTLTP